MIKLMKKNEFDESASMLYNLIEPFKVNGCSALNRGLITRGMITAVI